MYDHGGVSAADTTPPTASAGTPSGEASAPRRLRRSNPIRDMAISLAVLVVPLLALMALCQSGEPQVKTVDPARTFQAAKAEARFPVMVPADLPDGWRVTNASLNRADGGALTLRVSYLTSANTFIQLVQSDVATETVIVDELGGGKIQGTSDVGGVAWQRYAGRRAGETALVLLGPKATVIVVGDASLGDLRRLAGSLR